jgi:hypothetical protein
MVTKLNAKGPTSVVGPLRKGKFLLVRQCLPCAASQRSASSAAMPPLPALVTPWRYNLSAQAPGTNLPGALALMH